MIKNLKIKDIVNWDNLKGLIKILFPGLLIVIGTFPENIWTFDVGIDPPLVWVFNNLFSTNLSDGISIVFPHGPLAFFMYPLPENILLVTIVTALLKVVLFWNVFTLLKENNKSTRLLISFLICYFISIIAGFNHLILANILLFNCNYFVTRNKLFKYLSFALFIFAFYVKSYVAILSGAITAVSLIYFLVDERDYKQFAINVGILFSGLLMFWLLMFGTLNGFFTYLYGIINLAQDNSSAASIYQDNNWWFIGGYVLFVILAFANKEKRSLFFGLIAFFCLFAVWKHGMARQDVYHVNGMTSFIMIALLIFNIFSQKNRFKNIIFSVLAVFAISYNNQNALNYSDSEQTILKSNNFIEFIGEYKKLKTQNAEISENLIAANKLPPELLKIIGDAKTDIYPWDYSIIAANKLNWKPRVVIQSYAAYTSWLDKQNAVHFSSENAPEFIFWHNGDKLSGLNGGTVNSIDSRYLLNDEPQTLIEMIRNYKTINHDDTSILLQRRNTPLNIKSFVSEHKTTTWCKWIDVPEYQEGTLQRVKLDFKKSIKQSLKSAFFKDEQFWILMELNTGEIHKYRIVPKNATDGLWINPYALAPNQSFKVNRIMFMASNQKILSKNLKICWEQVLFDKSDDYFSLFNPKMNESSQALYNELNSFDNHSELSSNWTNFDNTNFGKQSFTGTSSFVLKPTSFTPSFSIPIDSLPEGLLHISTGCWTIPENNKNTKNVVLVISIDYPNGNNIWNGEAFKNHILNQNNWNYIKNYTSFHNKRDGGILKVYVWNNSNQDIIIDDFGVSVRGL
ncbi:MAG: hypothetical protein PHE33_00810 [Bacteroidales bacterium]|nr:hypothetical protein [Bacteroidales bacterium]